MRQKTIRLGSISLLFAVIVLCVAALCALSIATAHADAAVTDKYVRLTQDVSAAECAGQEWLADTDAAIAAKGAALQQSDLPAGTELDGSRIRVQLDLDSGRTMTIELRLTGDSRRYEILAWQNSARWSENQQIGNLWTGASSGKEQASQ